jgi:hypothetical protein
MRGSSRESHERRGAKRSKGVRFSPDPSPRRARGPPRIAIGAGRAAQPVAKRRNPERPRAGVRRHRHEQRSEWFSGKELRRAGDRFGNSLLRAVRETASKSIKPRPCNDFGDRFAHHFLKMVAGGNREPIGVCFCVLRHIGVCHDLHLSKDRFGKTLLIVLSLDRANR